LKFSFSGGTSLDEALEASTRRLSLEDCWSNADLLIVTDGEIPEPTEEVVGALDAACATAGTRVVGIVLSEETGSVMESLCTELYSTGNPDRLSAFPTRPRAPTQGGEEGNSGSTGRSFSYEKRTAPWPRLRRVQAQRPSIPADVAAGKRRVAVACGAPLHSTKGPRTGIFCGGASASSVGPRRLMVASGGGLVGCCRTVGCRVVAVNAAERRPDANSYSSALVHVIQAADGEARRLRQASVGLRKGGRPHGCRVP